MAFFPMFVNLDKKSCLVVGAGSVATRKVKVLTEFGADVYVVAPQICEELRQLETLCMQQRTMGRIFLEERAFTQKDCKDKVLVVAATNDNFINHEIAMACKEKHIPVNSVSNKEDCTFIFPAYVRQKDVVAAFSSSGKSPEVSQFLKLKQQEILDEKLGEINESIGRFREGIKEMFSNQEERKKVFRDILDFGLCNESAPTDEEIYALLEYIASNGRFVNE